MIKSLQSDVRTEKIPLIIYSFADRNEINDSDSLKAEYPDANFGADNIRFVQVQPGSGQVLYLTDKRLWDEITPILKATS